MKFSQPDLKNRLIAEVTFVRSLIFFNIVRVWGDVPMPLKVVSAAESYDYLRESEAVVYQ